MGELENMQGCCKNRQDSEVRGHRREVRQPKGPPGEECFWGREKKNENLSLGKKGEGLKRKSKGQELVGRVFLY